MPKGVGHPVRSERHRVHTARRAAHEAGRAACLTAAFLICACGSERPMPAAPQPLILVLTQQTSGSEALLQAVSAVDADVVWVSGHQATWARTLDGGETWSASTMEDEPELQFRDVEAFDARTAYLMSSGPGSLSRIYRTDDGGLSWALQYTAGHPGAFLDCMAFWDRDRGVAFGDAVEGEVFVLRTIDGGRTWSRVPASDLPRAQAGEGGFAASGTCVYAGAEGRAWIAAGNAEQARVLATSDWGEHWTAVRTGIVEGSGAGHTSIQVAPDGRGVVLGGVIGSDTVWTDNVAVTTDAGATWTLAGRPAVAGPVYGSALVPTTKAPSGLAAVAVGPRGMSLTSDFAATWQVADTLSYWAVAFAEPDAGWAVGPGGRIVRLALGGR